MIPNPYLTESKGNIRPRKRQRVQKLLRETRRRIPGLFDLVDDGEPLAKSLQISRLDLLEDVVRDLRRKMPQSEGVALDRRKYRVLEMPKREAA